MFSPVQILISLTLLVLGCPTPENCGEETAVLFEGLQSTCGSGGGGKCISSKSSVYIPPLVDVLSPLFFFSKKHLLGQEMLRQKCPCPRTDPESVLRAVLGEE